MGKKEKRINTSFSDKDLRKELLRRSVPLLRPYWKQLCLATLAMMLEAFLDVFRPWPLKVVIDRVLSQRPSRVPFLHVWLDNAPFTRMQVLYGACGATITIALVAGLLAYYYTEAMGMSDNIMSSGCAVTYLGICSGYPCDSTIINERGI